MTAPIYFFNPVFRGLMEDINEHPEDDFPRLALADWLMDGRDDAWGQFIVAQIQLHRLDSGNVHPDQIRSLKQVSEVLLERMLGNTIHPYFSGWKVGRMKCQSQPGRTVSIQVNQSGTVLKFHRGLLASVNCELKEFMRGGPILTSFDFRPTLTITNRKPYLMMFAGNIVYSWCSWTDESQPDYDHSELPDSIYTYLSVTPEQWQVWIVNEHKRLIWNYGTVGAAHSDLVRACWEYATAHKLKTVTNGCFTP